MTTEYQDFLAHYGVKGQRHGVRRYQNEDGSLTAEGRSHYGVGDKKDWRRIDRDAKKDAAEYVKAKAFYGEGAGIRRRKINGIVNERSRDADYKAAFDKYVSQQDTEKAKVAADRKRGFEDTKNAILRSPITHLAVSVATGIAVRQFIKTGGPQKVARWASRSVNSIKGAASRMKNRVRNARSNHQFQRDFVRKMRVVR